MANTATPRPTVFGLSGQHQRMVVQNVFTPTSDPRNSIPVGGGPGTYTVTFTLTRPGVRPTPEREFSFDQNAPGDSHLAITRPAINAPEGVSQIRLYSKTDDGDFMFTGFPTSAGFLQRLQTEITAQSFADAENKAYRAVAPSLSQWSAQLDIPMIVWRVYARAHETGNTQMSVVNPFDPVSFALAAAGGTISRDLRAFTSLYREAVNSNSIVYEYLCLFKIAEGVRLRRSRLAREAKERGESFSRPQERIPATPAGFKPWLNAIFPSRRPWDDLALESVFVRDARDRKINDLIDKELTDLRDSIAHALADASGEVTMSTDEALHISRVSHWLPLLKCIVRRMLKNEFPTEYLAFLGEDGTLRA